MIDRHIHSAPQGPEPAYASPRRGFCRDPIELGHRISLQLKVGRRQVLAQVLHRRCSGDQQDVGRAVIVARRAPLASASRIDRVGHLGQRWSTEEGAEAAEREERYINARRFYGGEQRRSAPRRRGGQD